jgi:hypothetical protein
MQEIQARAKVVFGLIKIFHTPIDQHVGKGSIHIDVLA